MSVEAYFLIAFAVLSTASFFLMAYSNPRGITGSEGMVGKTGTVRSALSPAGKVFVRGELWDAKTDDGSTVEPGTKVKVLKVDGMELVVKIK